MNYFFALELPDDVREELAAQINRWRSELDPLLKLEGWSPYDWVEPRDYHITLKFLGNVSESAIDRAIEKAQPIAEARQPFKVRLAPAGGFQKSRTSNAVVWMGVRHDPDLEELAQTLNEAILYPHTLAAYGLPNTIASQQKYQPHITIARGIWSPEKLGYRMTYEQSFPSWQVDSFVLMETLPPEKRANGAKARYTIVHTFPFGNTH
jgi:2'-5' RNA ligase